MIIKKFFLKPGLFKLNMSVYSSALASPNVAEDVRVIDIRSDTVTKPTPEMRDAMARALVGDDVYGEDPTANALQEKVAKLFGKDAALFVPTGTMGNLISIMGHCTCRGDELLAGDQSHIILYEQGSAAQIAGVHTRQVKNQCDGSLDLAELESKIRQYADTDPHSPRTRLICLEQTHNNLGGRVLQLDYLKKVRDLADKYDIKLHMDGARLFNAAVSMNEPVSKIVEHMDSVNFCLSKGLGSPVGSLIVGNKDFIKRCVWRRKSLGGGMRQIGVLAAAGIYSLDNIVPKLHQDHKNTKALAEGLSKMKNYGIMIDAATVETNILYFKFHHKSLTAFDLQNRLESVSDDDPLKTRVVVKVLAFDSKTIRAVLHHQISSDDVQAVLIKLHFALEKCTNQ